MKKFIVPILLLSLFSNTAYATDGKEIEESCPVVPPVIQTVYVDKIIYVDKLIPGPTVYVDRVIPGSTVYVDKPIEKIVYVDKPIIETKTVTIEKPIEHIVTVENEVTKQQLLTLKVKYARLLKSYKLMRKHEMAEAEKHKIKNNPIGGKK